MGEAELYAGRRRETFNVRYVLFCCQKRTRKPPAISTRWIHEKGAARPFQTPKEKSKRKKASRFAKRFFSRFSDWNKNENPEGG